jgi:hypothetical protein
MSWLTGYLQHEVVFTMLVALCSTQVFCLYANFTCIHISGIMQLYRMYLHWDFFSYCKVTLICN